MSMSEWNQRAGLIVAAVLAVFLLCVSALHVTAQTSNCAPYMAVKERLETKYGERRQSIGVAANNNIVEVFASGDTGSWTIVSTDARGNACIIASGENFENWVDSTPEGDAA